jgi:hypothetical protein
MLVREPLGPPARIQTFEKGDCDTRNDAAQFLLKLKGATDGIDNSKPVDEIRGHSLRTQNGLRRPSERPIVSENLILGVSVPLFITNCLQSVLRGKRPHIV